MEKTNIAMLGFQEQFHFSNNNFFKLSTFEPDDCNTYYVMKRVIELLDIHLIQ